MSGWQEKHTKADLAAHVERLEAEIARLTAERDAATVERDDAMALFHAADKKMRALAALQPDTERADPVAWLPDVAYNWLISYDGTACARMTAIHRAPLKNGSGIPLYTAPQPAPAPQAREITVQAAAAVLLSNDIAIARMAEGIHDGPLMADDHEFSAARPQGSWCVDAVRAALRTLAAMQKGG